QLLQRAVSRLDDELKDQPGLKAELYGDLGEIQFNLGDFGGGQAALEHALAEQRQRLGNQSLEVARTLYRLAGVTFANDQRQAAEAQLADALAILGKLGQGRSLDAARVKARLASFQAERQGAQAGNLALMAEARLD